MVQSESNVDLSSEQFTEAAILSNCKIHLIPDENGLVEGVQVLNALHIGSFQIPNENSCSENWHHLLFNSKDVERQIGSVTDNYKRNLLNFFYRSPFAGVQIAMCAHKWVQENTESMDFPSYDVIEQLRKEYTDLSVFVNAVRSIRRTHRKITTGNGMVPQRSAKQRIRDAEGEPLTERLRVWKIAKHIWALTEAKNDGRLHLKQRLVDSLDSSNILLTPHKVSEAGSFTGLLESILESRKISHEKIVEGLVDKNGIMV